MAETHNLKLDQCKHNIIIGLTKILFVHVR